MNWKCQQADRNILILNMRKCNNIMEICKSENDHLSFSLWRDMTWGIVCSGNPHLHTHRQKAISLATNCLPAWLLTRSYNSASGLKREHPVNPSLARCREKWHMFAPMVICGWGGVSHETMRMQLFHIWSTLLITSACCERSMRKMEGRGMETFPWCAWHACSYNHKLKGTVKTHMQQPKWGWHVRKYAI